LRLGNHYRLELLMTYLRSVLLGFALLTASITPSFAFVPPPSITNYIGEIQDTLSYTFQRLGVNVTDPRFTNTLAKVKSSLAAESAASPTSTFLDLAAGGLAADGMTGVALLPDLGSLANPLFAVAANAPLVFSAGYSTANWIYNLYAPTQTVPGATTPLPIGKIAMPDVPADFKPPTTSTTAANTPPTTQTVTVPPTTASAPAQTITLHYPSPALDPNALYFPTSGSPAADVTIYRFTVTSGGLPTSFYPIGTDLQQVLSAAEVVDPSLSIQSATYLDPTTIQVQTSDGPWTVGVTQGSLAGLPTPTEVLSQTSEQTFFMLCNPGFVSESVTCVAAPTIVNPIPITIPETQVAQILPPDAMTAPISPQLVAALANQVWQQVASQPGTQTVPYSITTPATQTDAQTAIQHETSPITPGDLLVPPQTQTSSATTPTTGASTPTTSTPTSPAPAASLALGTDPGITAPGLSPPTGPSILAPITSLLPDFFGYSLNIPAGTCPAPTLDLFGNQYVFDAQCVLFAKYGPLLTTALVAAYTLAALFLVLSA
jgi:hypothetical protein